MDQFALSIIRQGVALYKRGYSSVVTTIAWGVQKQAAHANGDIPFGDVTEEQYEATLGSLTTEFQGTSLLDLLPDEYPA